MGIGNLARRGERAATLAALVDTLRESALESGAMSVYWLLFFFYALESIIAAGNYQSTGVLISSFMAISMLAFIHFTTPVILEVTPKRRMNKSRAGYVYVIKSMTDDTYYKIGRTNNPERRMRKFNVVLPFEITPVCLIKTNDMYKLESDLHTKYAQYRADGEWFKLPVSAINELKKLANKGATE